MHTTDEDGRLVSTWCDSAYAVDPREVRANAEKLSGEQIVERLSALRPGPEWVTLSGGNPALLDLDPFVGALHLEGFQVAVETQGSRWRDWLGAVDSLTVSPKPPSSGMAAKTANDLPGFMRQARERGPRGVGLRSPDALKIVVFDDADLAWAVERFADYPQWPRFLSCGTGIGEPLADTAARYRWLCERVAATGSLCDVRVLPQLHVVAWGHARGV